MRFTVVDHAGTTSFLGPAHLLKMLTAACSRGANDFAALIAALEAFDPVSVRQIRSALVHNEDPAPQPSPPPPSALIHVTDEASRRESLAPAAAGLVVFNLAAKRIIQIQNSYAEVRRQDRGRLRRDGRPVRAYYTYSLPDDWTIVP